MLYIPRRFPPVGIILLGHLLAVASAFGLAIAPRAWWGGLLAAAGVAGNHASDMVDGTHARATNQCRNGGELLDHFTDPLSFAYWAIALTVSVHNLVLAPAAVIIIYATAVLTSIKAKLIGRFTLVRFGPTEMKILYVMYGLVACVVVIWRGSPDATTVAKIFFWFMLAIGALQLIVNLVVSVREVNAHGAAPDTAPWVLGSGANADGDGAHGTPADDAHDRGTDECRRR